MSAAPAFVVWTLQRTGGTNLARHLIERAGLPARLEAAQRAGAGACERLAAIADGWSLHEPFNAGAARRAFGDVTEAWSARRDAPALASSVAGIVALGLPLKHCVEMVPWELSEALAGASSRAGFRHVFLYRRNALGRLLSLQFARLTGLWGPQLKGSVDFAGRARGVGLPVAELAAHELHSSGLLARAWEALGALGAERLAIAFEDICEAGAPAAARRRLLELLCFLGLDEGGAADRRLAERIRTGGGQDTRGEYAGFEGIPELERALEAVPAFRPANRLRVLRVESPGSGLPGIPLAVLDDFPAAPRAGRDYALGGVVVAAGRSPADRLELLAADGAREIRWGLPSPRVGERFPQLAGSANARFLCEGLRLDAGLPGEIRLLRPGEEPRTLFRLLPAWRRD